MYERVPVKIWFADFSFKKGVGDTPKQYMWPSSPKMWLYNECKIWLMNTGQQQQKIFLRIPMKAILKSLKIIASHWAPLMIPLAKIRGDIYLMISWYVPVCHCIDDWIQCGVKVACRYHMMNHNHICKTDKIFIYVISTSILDIP